MFSLLHTCLILFVFVCTASFVSSSSESIKPKVVLVDESDYDAPLVPNAPATADQGQANYLALLRAREIAAVQAEQAKWEMIQAQDERGLEELGEEPKPECVVEGTMHDMRRAAQRLMYEGEAAMSEACYMKAMSLYLTPGSNFAHQLEIEKKRKANLSQKEKEEMEKHDLQFKSLLQVSHGMSDQAFEDFGHMVDLLQWRSEQAYSLPWSPIRSWLHTNRAFQQQHRGTGWAVGFDKYLKKREKERRKRMEVYENMMASNPRSHWA